MNSFNKIRLFVSVIALVMLTAHLWLKRYYFRFIPIPINFIDVINEGSYFFPSSQLATPRGRVTFSTTNLASEVGLRNTLNEIQTMSPLASVEGLPKGRPMTFENWFSQIKKTAFFCTDGTQLFILAAWSQGLRAREWHLLPEGWPPGQGHSVAEFYNPRTGKWQLVDAQHAAIIRNKKGAILSMSDVLKEYIKGRGNQIAVDYGPYRTAMLEGARGPTTEEYFFQNNLLKTPVLQLRQASWFAETPKKFGLSGHLVIGYPIIFGSFRHNPQIILTKVSFIGILILTLLIFKMCRRSSRQKRKQA